MKAFKVLIVDDDQYIRRIAEISLTRVAKWEVVLAESGAQALLMIPQEKPDVILLDVMMPMMDGPTTLRKIRENDEMKGIPVIFVTAKVQPHEVDKYLRMDAAGVISKPFDPIALPQEITEILTSRMAEARMIA